MSEWIAYAGGALLTAATLPQLIRLARTREAASFAWGFVLMNAIGISLLAWRSWEIGERAFLALNVTTALFWAFVAALKLRALARRSPPRSASRRPKRIGPH